jgi:hypothetical protein
VLLVRVTDDGAGTAVLDGTVHAGPRRGSGWEVVATIPVVGRDGIPSGS